jgi:Ca2+-binding RTX toxin-like protein
MYGDSGDDTFFVTPEDWPATIHGGYGTDSLVLSSPDYANLFDINSCQIVSIERLIIDSPYETHVNLSGEQFQYGEFAPSLLISAGSGANTISIGVEADSSFNLSGLTFENWDSDDHVVLELITNNSTIMGTSLSDRIQGLVFNSTINGGGGDDVFALEFVDGSTIEGGDGWDKFLLTESLQFVSGTFTNFEEVVFEADCFFRLAAHSFWNGFGGAAPVFSGVSDHSVSVAVFLWDEPGFDGSSIDISGWGSDDLFTIASVGPRTTPYSVIGTKYDDYIGGTALNDTLNGGQGGDTIESNGGADVVRGDAGDDWLTGQAGRDSLNGGAGADTIDYNAVSDSAAGYYKRDHIWFFRHADTIDVSDIDANELVAGNQAFKIDAGGTFVAGEIRITAWGSDWLVSFNTDGDADAEMQIMLHNSVKPWASDFVL